MAKQFVALAIALAGLVALTACGGDKAASAPAELTIREAVEVADPQAAIDAIYDTLEGSVVKELGAQGLIDELQLQPSQLEAYYIFVSDANYGLCDIILLEVPEGTTEEGREVFRKALFSYQDKRMAEFKNFDIWDSSLIAQNAAVFDQGNFVIMLMLPDNEAAQELIDQYIPR